MSWPGGGGLPPGFPGLGKKEAPKPAKKKFEPKASVLFFPPCDARPRGEQAAARRARARARLTRPRDARHPRLPTAAHAHQEEAQECVGGREWRRGAADDSSLALRARARRHAPIHSPPAGALSRRSQAGSKIPKVFPTTKCQLRALKLERIKDFLLMEREFITNQELLRPKAEREGAGASAARARALLLLLRAAC